MLSNIRRFGVYLNWNFLEKIYFRKFDNSHELQKLIKLSLKKPLFPPKSSKKPTWNLADDTRFISTTSSEVVRRPPPASEDAKSFCFSSVPFSPFPFICLSTSVGFPFPRAGDSLWKLKHVERNRIRFQKRRRGEMPWEKLENGKCRKKSFSSSESICNIFERWRKVL